MSSVADGPGPDGAGPEEAPLEVPPPTMTPRLAAAALLLEAFVVFFATLVATRTVAGPGGPSVTTVFVTGGALVLLFVLASGVVRRPGGLAVGTALQVVLVALGLVVPVMVVVGLLFVGLWWWLVWIGRKVDRDRRRWAADLAAGGTGAP